MHERSTGLERPLIDLRHDPGLETWVDLHLQQQNVDAATLTGKLSSRSPAPLPGSSAAWIRQRIRTPCFPRYDPGCRGRSGGHGRYGTYAACSMAPAVMVATATQMAVMASDRLV
jgi:hypothetical protein